MTIIDGSQERGFWAAANISDNTFEAINGVVDSGFGSSGRASGFGSEGQEFDTRRDPTAIS